jgi:hypothetical protein
MSARLNPSGKDLVTSDDWEKAGEHGTRLSTKRYLGGASNQKLIGFKEPTSPVLGGAATTSK